MLHVEAEVEIDGITILAVLPPKEKASASGRIEMLGSSKPVAGRDHRPHLGGRSRRPRVTFWTARGRGGGTGGRDRRPARGGARPDSRRPQPGETTAEGGDRRPDRRPRPDAAPGGPSSGAAAGRPTRASAERRPERRPRVEGAPGDTSSPADSGVRRCRAASAPDSRLPGSSRTARGRAGPDRRPTAGWSADRPRPPARRTAARASSREPRTATCFWRALLPNSVRLRNGSLREVLQESATRSPKNRRAPAPEGRPEVSGDRDPHSRGAAGPVGEAGHLARQGRGGRCTTRDDLAARPCVRTVASAAPRDEAARELDRKLREELDRRIKKLRSHWEEQITHALEEGRVLQALRFSAQPPTDRPVPRVTRRQAHERRGGLHDRQHPRRALARPSRRGKRLAHKAPDPPRRPARGLDGRSRAPGAARIGWLACPCSHGRALHASTAQTDPRGSPCPTDPSLGTSTETPEQARRGTEGTRGHRRLGRYDLGKRGRRVGASRRFRRICRPGPRRGRPPRSSHRTRLPHRTRSPHRTAPASDTTEAVTTGEIPPDPVPAEISEDTATEEPVTEPAPGGGPVRRRRLDAPASADAVQRLPAQEDPGPAPADS